MRTNREKIKKAWGILVTVLAITMLLCGIASVCVLRALFHVPHFVLTMLWIINILALLVMFTMFNNTLYELTAIMIKLAYDIDCNSLVFKWKKQGFNSDAIVETTMRNICAKNVEPRPVWFELKMYPGQGKFEVYITMYSDRGYDCGHVRKIFYQYDQDFRKFLNELGDAFTDFLAQNGIQDSNDVAKAILDCFDRNNGFRIEKRIGILEDC